MSLVQRPSKSAITAALASASGITNYAYRNKDTLRQAYKSVSSFIDKTRMARTKSKARKLLREADKLKKKTKVTKRVRFSKRYRNRYRKKNVKPDVDGYTKSYKKMRVTKQQQRKINRLFKSGYSPFKYCESNGFQDTRPNLTDKPKWVWRNLATFYQTLGRAWNKWPTETSIIGTTQQPSQPYNFLAANNYIYINKITYKYEIVNPTNYDMNLVIYDIVCKEDTEKNTESIGYYGQGSLAGFDQDDPITKMIDGSIGFSETPPGWESSNQFIQVGDPTQKSIKSINYKPTESYPFNIYWKIIRKHTVKLQPGAILHHKFTYKPKALISRGYYAWKYAHHFGTVLEEETRIGVKDITCGCLFKYWGQVAGSGVSTSTHDYQNEPVVSQNPDEVTTLSGRITFKEEYEMKWQTLSQRYTYTFNQNNITWKPDDEETIEVVNDASTKPVDDAEMTTEDTTNDNIHS